MLPKAAHSFGVGSVNRLRIHQRRTISVGDMISYSSLTDADVVASVVRQEGENNNFDNIPGPADKRLIGKGEKLTYSPAAGCNWFCLTGV